MEMNTPRHVPAVVSPMLYLFVVRDTILYYKDTIKPAPYRRNARV
jgi:hypothetical protein